MYERILVGTDGSNTAADAVARAVQVAATSGASLTIMTAGKQERGRAVVETAAAGHAGSGVAIDTVVVDADPVQGMIDLASSGGYDLVVVGNKGMTGMTRFLKPGAVANKLSHAVPTNMLIVRTT